jgi:hypothetical protein
MMEIRNPKYTATGRIDCEINHPEFGWLPFTASPEDAEPHGREIFALAEALGPAAYDPPEPAPPTIEGYSAAVQAHLDAAARARLYTDGNSLATYTASTNPQWAAEAQAFVAWRDAVWQQVYAMWASPPDPVPSPEEVVAGLPVIEWPEVGE